MSPENDQTRWIGIRPTNPAENIPVTESAPLEQIKVEPLAVGTEFKTLTEKRSPAIADLQAIKETYIEHPSRVNADCSVFFDLHAADVAADTLCIVNNIWINNRTSICDVFIYLIVDDAYRIIMPFHRIAVGVGAIFQGFLIIKPGDNLMVRFNLGGALDTAEYYCSGYLIGTY